jgi:ATP-dependent protease ClpP protease subunit
MVGHIYIYGEIENIQVADANSYGVCSLKSVVDSFNSQSDAESFIVHIHSNGGDVHEGLAIYDFLKNCGKEITTRVEGMCASISSVILLAGSKREATENAKILIHNAWTVAMGDHNELEQTSKSLKMYSDLIKKIYVKETGMSIEDLSELMDKETTFNLEQSITNGFIHSEVNQLKAVAKIKNENMSTLFEKAKELLGKKEAEVIKNVVLTLADGTQVQSDSEEATPKIGDSITFEDGTVVPDGEHELQSGDIVITEGGKVTEVMVNKEEIEEVDSEEMVALREENETLKAKVTSFENSINENNESIKNLTSETKEAKELLEEMTKVYSTLKNSVSKEIDTKDVEIETKGLISRVKTK